MPSANQWDSMCGLRPEHFRGLQLFAVQTPCDSFVPTVRRRSLSLFPHPSFPTAQYVFLLFAFLFSSCSQSTPPVPPSSPDTTSQDFTWTVETLGDGNGSILNDVAIINDSLAYAVGEIYVKDSTGQFGPFPDNLMVWDGTRWTRKRVTVNFRGNPTTGPLRGIFAFSPKEIWLMADLPIYGDGTNWTIFDLRTTVDPNLSLFKGWGSSPTEMYFVGQSGSIARYSGGAWRKIESGTNLDIYDIWGDGGEIYAVAAKRLENFQKEILRIRGTVVDTMSTFGIPFSLESIWYESANRYFVVGDGIFANHNIEGTTPWEVLHNGVTVFHTYRIRGNATNDIAVCGSYGELLHWNGSSWKSFRNATALTQGAYFAIATKGNLIIAVGYEDPKGVVAVGRRR